MLKRLPIGLSSWAQIRREELFFCDKTDQLPQLVQHFPRAFLSAPRRSGKTHVLKIKKRQNTAKMA